MTCKSESTTECYASVGSERCSHEKFFGCEDRKKMLREERKDKYGKYVWAVGGIVLIIIAILIFKI